MDGVVPGWIPRSSRKVVPALRTIVPIPVRGIKFSSVQGTVSSLFAVLLFAHAAEPGREQGPGNIVPDTEQGAGYRRQRREVRAGQGGAQPRVLHADFQRQRL